MTPSHSKSIAIVGAGISGSVLARNLREVANISVFEKSRGISGRLATRYHDTFSFDHGAPFFTARSPEFKNFIAPWVAAGHLEDWQPKTTTLSSHRKPYSRSWFEPHYIAPKKMNQWCKALMGDISVTSGVEITTVTKRNSQWYCQDKNGEEHGPFDWVISTTPSHQAATWLPTSCTFLDAVKAVHMTPSYSLLLGFENAKQAPKWEMAKCLDSPLNWVVIENSKPGHNPLEDGDSLSMTLHTTATWAAAELDTESTTVSSKLLGALFDLVGDLSCLGELRYQSLHRWRYASVSNNRPDNSAATPVEKQTPPYLIDHQNQLAAAGDWCLYGDVDSAYCSAAALAKHLIANL